MSDHAPESPTPSSPAEPSALGEHQVQDRRKLLASALGLAAGAGAIAGCSKPSTTGDGTGAEATEETLPFGLDEANFENHGTAPLTLETKRALLTGLVTPTDLIFVRNNNGPPADSALNDPDGWSTEFLGFGSGDGRTLTLKELKGIGHETVAAVLQCSGNGRRFFEHGASGSQWGVGAAANALWTGVPLRRVISALGAPVTSARFLTARGGDTLPPVENIMDVVVERSVPIEHALRHGILAWSMNGEPLGPEHGGPLRLVVPGYYGVNQVKHVARVALTDAESGAKIQSRGYRVRPIGEGGDPSQPSMWEMNVKSWITAPLENPGQGETFVTGVAFSGGSPIQRVEVSVDGGAKWQDAEFLGPDLGPFAWRTFALRWNAKAGTHTLVSRATDASGAVQPEERFENQRGYRHNGWRDPGVEITIA